LITSEIREGATMAVHDWTRVDSGLFHAFHQHWITSLCAALNTGGLPPDYFALPEQRIKGPIPDVLALRLAVDEKEDSGGGLSVATAPPRTRQVFRSDADVYADKADRITVRHRHGEVVSVIEIVSPGNKSSQAALDEFLEKATALIRGGIHLLVIDLLPPGRRDPQGIHKAIWDAFAEDDFEPPPDKPLVLASYDAGPPEVAYVESIGVGDPLPNDMPLFLRREIYVPAPLEATYQTTWSVFPNALKGLLES
jgi:hypothetical protein